MLSSTIKQTVVQLQACSFFSRLELLQILKMLAGYKSTARLIYSERNKVSSIVKLLHYLQINVSLTSSHGFRGIKDRGKGGWSNLCTFNHKRKEYCLYLSTYGHDGKLAQEADASGDDTLFGNKLSYPPCCSCFFNDNFGSASKRQGDLFPFVYRNTRDNLHILPSLLNTSWYFDAGYIEYWPCSFRCPHALAEAAIGKKLLEAYLPDIAKEVDAILNAPVLYSEYSGIFIFHKAKYDAEQQTLHYDAAQIQATATTALAHALSLGNRLVFCQDHWNIYMDKRKKHPIMNKGACLAIFSNSANTMPSLRFAKLKQVEALQLQLPGTTPIEIVMMAIGKKRAMRLIVTKQNHPKAVQLARILDLKMYESPLRVSVLSSPGTGDEYVEYVHDAPSEASYLICYAKTLSDAKACAELEIMDGETSKHNLNHYLNYPQCCVESFLRRTPHEDWLTPFLKNTPISRRYPVWTNRIGYLFNGIMPLYDYEPCSAFCKESLDLADSIRHAFQTNNVDFVLKGLVQQCMTPIFLHYGILVYLQDAKISEHLDETEICYRLEKFLLKDYNLQKESENSIFWQSNRLVVNQHSITILHDDKQLISLKQSQYDNRIFIFEE